MELQDNGRAVNDGSCGLSTEQRLRRQLDWLFRGNPIGWLCLMLLTSGLAYAQSTRYVYDANGRVVATTTNNGASVEYGYNTLGQTGQVSAPLSSGQLAIFSVVPTHGVAGTQVTVQGQGFDSNPANDTVSFNGTVATVLSASTTQLVTTVPSGATTGTLSVKVSGQTAVSAAPFTVDDSGVPPVINQVGPLVVPIGGAVTITGTHLAPATGATIVQMGRRGVMLTSAADASLQYTVPSDAASGFVTVQTPYGVASSSTPVFVLPSNISASNVVSSGYAAANGTGVTLNIGAGQAGVVLFDATQSPWISLQASNMTTTASSISYTVYGPGDVVVQQGSISSSSPSIHLPELLAEGNYVAVFQPNAGSAQFTINVETDAMLTTAAAPRVTASALGQSKRVVLNTIAAQNLEFTFNGVSGSSSPVVTQIYDAGGNVIVNTNACYSTWTCRYSIWNTEDGTYAVIIAPSDAGTTLAFDALLQPDTQGGGLTANTPVTVHLGMGQVARYTFTATQGSNVALSLSSVNTGNAAWPMVVNVYGPTDVITTSNYYTTFSVLPGGDGTNGAAVVNLTNLPASGTYTIVISSSGVPETAQLAFSSSPIHNVPSDGTNESASASLSGQNIYFRFSANPGDNLELTLTNVSIVGASSGSATVTLNVYDANGNNIASGNDCQNTWTCRYPLWNLAGGSYTVVLSPPDIRSTIGTDIMLEPDSVAGTLSAMAPANINLAMGQVERYTFAGTQGSNAVLNLSSVNTGNINWPLNVAVYSPATGTITPYNAFATFRAFGTNGATLNLANLPASGTYTVVVYTSGIPVTGQLSLLPNTTSSILDNGSDGNYVATYPGQNIYLSFTANQGDNLEFTLDNVSITGTSSSNVGLNVYDANGTNITSANNCENGWSCRYALWNLAAGTYTVVISPPDTTSTISTHALLEPDVLGGTLSANTPANINLSLGQVDRYTFTASQGSNVALSLSAVNTGQAAWPINVSVYAPNGDAITPNSYLATFNAPGNNGCNTLNLSNLPATGTYTLVVWTSAVPGTAQLNWVSQ